MLELATLGLLQKEPLHGYRLKKQLELFMSGCISVNYGAIYPLLKRLEAKGLIRSFSEEEGNNNRKNYSITDQGRRRWKEKMLEHPQESWVNARSRFMIKFFFFNYLAPEERLKLMELRLMTCCLQLENKELEIAPDDPFQLAAYQKYCSDIALEIEWIEQQLTVETSCVLPITSTMTLEKRMASMN
jgi:DNA-binding PadR family transcriptional regulator